MMNRVFKTLPILFLAAVSPLQAQQEKEEKPDPNRVEGKATVERIQASAQWTELFNGKNLEGWHGDTEGYIAKDGKLICQAGAKNLYTDKEYSDFVFKFQFKLTESGNNGLGIRVPKDGHASRDGMELQILDHRGTKYNSKSEDGKRTLTWLKPWQVHGSLYSIYPATTGYLKPLDEWNEQFVICIEDHVKIVLNGAVILDAYLDDITPVDGKDHPGMRNKSGHIMFAGHSDHIEFKDISVADFSLAPPEPKTDSDNTAPEGFAELFNGKDLSGWKGLADKDANKRRALKGEELKMAQAEADKVMNEHWSVNEGVLTYDGTGQSLCTAKDYGDFEMYVDWKIPSGADSGIYLRGTPQIQIWDPWDMSNKDIEKPETAEEWLSVYRTGRNLGSGGLWNNKRASNRPLVLADKKPGEWNTFLIRMVGDNVSIWLNGKLVVDRTELENFWDRDGDRDIPLPRADQIELQHHGSELFFKNLYIRELPY